MQQVIRRHTQVVQALPFVSQIDFHPLCPVIFWKRRSGFTTGASLATTALYFASRIAAVVKFKMGGPSLELSLLAKSSVLLVCKTKI